MSVVNEMEESREDNNIQVIEGNAEYESMEESFCSQDVGEEILFTSNYISSS